MTHPQVFGQKCTPVCRFSARKTHPFWPHIPNMTQYGSPPGPYRIVPISGSLFRIAQFLDRFWKGPLDLFSYPCTLLSRGSPTVQAKTTRASQQHARRWTKGLCGGEWYPCERNPLRTTFWNRPKFHGYDIVSVRTVCVNTC